jgi:hypothetical protein
MLHLMQRLAGTHPPLTAGPAGDTELGTALLGASRLSTPDADEILQALDASVADISDPELAS